MPADQLQKMREVPVRRELGNVVVAAVQPHAFGVGEHPAGRGNAAG